MIRNGAVAKWECSGLQNRYEWVRLPPAPHVGNKKSFYWEKLEPEKLWYFIGLITSDGCLCNDGRHIDITSKDISLLEDLKKSLDITNRITPKDNGQGSESFRIQIGSVSFYEFLLSIGLSPKKSLTLKDLKVPKNQFDNFLRGLIDGDGCIRRWIHPWNKCEQWSLRIYAGSKHFLDWLHDRIKEKYEVSGKIHNNDQRYNSSLVLKFGKLAAQEILMGCYGKNNEIALKRKQKLARLCVGIKRGWHRSKTIKTKLARVVELVDTRDSSI